MASKSAALSLLDEDDDHIMVKTEPKSPVEQDRNSSSVHVHIKQEVQDEVDMSLLTLASSKTRSSSLSRSSYSIPSLSPLSLSSPLPSPSESAATVKTETITTTPSPHPSPPMRRRPGRPRKTPLPSQKTPTHSEARPCTELTMQQYQFLMQQLPHGLTRNILKHPLAKRCPSMTTTTRSDKLDSALVQKCQALTNTCTCQGREHDLEHILASLNERDRASVVCWIKTNVVSSV